MRVYLAGPMTGIPEFNFPLFHKAAALLRDAGHDVFNPADECIKRYGVDPSKDNPTGCEDEAKKKCGFDRRADMGVNLAWICAHAEAIVLLPGWCNSRGARAEFFTASALGLSVITLRIWKSSVCN